MKSASAIVLIAMFGLLAGCSTTRELPPGSSQSTAGGASTAANGSPSDVRPGGLYQRPPRIVDMRSVAVSTALNPNDSLGSGYDVTPTQHTDIVKIVPVGTMTSLTVPIDTVAGEATIFLTPQSDSPLAIEEALRNVLLLDPVGAQVNVRAPKNGRMVEAPLSSISLEGHPTGMYTVKFLAPTKVGLAVEARLAASNIVMGLHASTSQHLLGNQSFIDVSLTEAGHPIVGAHVSSDLIMGTDLTQVSQITFAEVGGGVYRAAIHSVLGPQHEIGAYLADIRAEGTSPAGLPFYRHGRTGFHYGIPTAQISDVVGQRTLTDASGTITGFEVDLAIDSSAVDRLEISGKLAVTGSDGVEHPIGIAHYGAGFSAGKSVVTLHFDAGQLRLTKMEGDFKVRDLQIFSLGTNTLFHRELLGRGQAFNGISRHALARLPQLTPAQQGLVDEGVFSAD